MRANEFLTEKWTQKYKSSINCSHPKGFSQKAHCAGKKKHNEDMTMEAVCPDCGMCQTHGNLNEIKKGAKDSNGFTKCWPGKHAAGTKKGRNGGQVRNCVPNEGVAEGGYSHGFADPLAPSLGRRFRDRDSGDDEPQGMFMVMIDGRPWKEFTSNMAFQRAKSIATKYPDKKVQVRWPTGQLNTVNEQGVAEGEKHGLYYNVNKRKAAGTSRDASSPKAPTAQAWKDAAKTAKKESVTEGSQNSAQEQINQILRSQAPNGDFTSDRYLDWIIGPESIDRLVQRTKLPLNRVRHYVTAFRQNPDPEGVAEGGGAQQAAIAIAKKKSGNYTKTGERLAKEDWNKVNHHDKTNGLSQKAVNAYRHEHPGSKLKTAVTTKPSKLKAGSKAAKRRKSFCARMSGNKGPMKTPSGKPTPKALALRRWHCESLDELYITANQRIYEAEGDEQGLKHLTPHLARDILDQIDKDGVEAIVKSIEWGDGGAKELIAMIKRDLEQVAGKKKTLTPNDIHALADSKGVAWDDEPSFLQLTKRLTGKEHLDDLDQAGLLKVKNHLENLKENFADGRHPEDKGDSKRYHVPTKASVSTLRKVAHQGGRKGQLAHWMANMKAGRAKHAGK